MKKYLHKINIIMTIQFDNFVSWHKSHRQNFYEHSFTDRDFFYIYILHFHRMYRGSSSKKNYFSSSISSARNVLNVRINESMKQIGMTRIIIIKKKKNYVHKFYCIFNDINLTVGNLLSFAAILPLYWIMWLQLLFCFLARFFFIPHRNDVCGNFGAVVCLTRLADCSWRFSSIQLPLFVLCVIHFGLLLLKIKIQLNILPRD